MQAAPVADVAHYEEGWDQTNPFNALNMTWRIHRPTQLSNQW